MLEKGFVPASEQYQLAYAPGLAIYWKTKFIKGLKVWVGGRNLVLDELRRASRLAWILRLQSRVSMSYPNTRSSFRP